MFPSTQVQILLVQVLKAADLPGFCFTIEPPGGKAYLLDAHSDDNRKEWMDALRNNIECPIGTASPTLSEVRVLCVCVCVFRSCVLSPCDCACTSGPVREHSI